MRSTNSVLRRAVGDPPGMVEDLEAAEADYVPSRRRMIPVAESALREAVPGLEIGDVVGREGDFARTHAVEKIAHAVHVLAPIEIAFGDEVLGVAAGDFVGVGEIVGMR